MLFLSVASLAGTLYIFRKLAMLFIEISRELKKLKLARIINVSEAIGQLTNMKPFRTLFVVVKGILRSRNNFVDSKDIFSAIHVQKRVMSDLKNYVKPRSFQQIARQHFWRSPFDLSQLSFDIQDMHSEGVIGVNHCKQESISGALTEVVSVSVPPPVSSGPLSKALTLWRKLLRRISLFDNTTNWINSGEDVTQYSIRDGQYAVVVGELKKLNGRVVFDRPKYVSKQLSFIKSRLKKQRVAVGIVMAMAFIMVLWFSSVLLTAIQKWSAAKEEMLDPRNQMPSDLMEADKATCVVCYEHVRSLVFKPCLHYGLCKRCYLQLRRKICPFCKTGITDVIQIIRQ